MKPGQHQTKDEKSRVDVVVVGGGPAGIAAGLTAARGGAETMLLERAPGLGGNVRSAFVHTICGLYENDTEEVRPVNPTLPHRFADRLRERGGAGTPYQAGRLQVLPLYPDRMVELTHELTTDQEGLAVRCSTPVRDVEKQSSGWVLTAANEKGDEEQTVLAPVVIDASGDAVVASMAGVGVNRAPFDELQIPSYIVKLSGVPEEVLEGYERLSVQHTLAEQVRVGALPEGCESVLLRPAAEPGTGYMTLNMPRENGYRFNPFEKRELELIEQEARRRVERIVEVLRSAKTSFRHLEVASYPERIGVRETRRVDGACELTADHLLEGRNTEEAVAQSSWPLELWDTHRNPTMKYPEGVADIPLRSLVSREEPSLGAAGRCMSATHEALGALRVIGTAMATGEAIGAAAALAGADARLTDVRVEHIHRLKQECHA